MEFIYEILKVLLLKSKDKDMNISHIFLFLNHSDNINIINIFYINIKLLIANLFF